MLTTHTFLDSHALHCIIDHIRHWFKLTLHAIYFITQHILLSERVSKQRWTTMPWRIAYGCDNVTHKSSSGVSFHCLPLNNPPLLKQISCMDCVKLIPGIPLMTTWCLIKFRLENPPIADKNAQVYSEHFNEDGFAGAIFPGFEPTKQTLKPDTVLTNFCFVLVPKRRKTSEVRIARAEHRDTLNTLPRLCSVVHLQRDLQ